MANNYINNKRFEKVIKGFLEEPDKYEGELVSMLDILITNIFNSFNFLIEFEDAKQECFLLIFKSLRNFKPGNGSAFNYFTTIIMNNLRLLYTKNKTYKKKIDNYLKSIQDKDPYL